MRPEVPDDLLDQQCDRQTLRLLDTVTALQNRAGVARRHERKASGRLPGCGFPRYLHLRWDRDRVFVLAIWKGRVDSIGTSARTPCITTGSAD